MPTSYSAARAQEVDLLQSAHAFEIGSGRLRERRHAPAVRRRAGRVAGHSRRALRFPGIFRLMHAVDWTIIAIYLAWIVWDGIRLTKRSSELEGYFLAGR